jgi:hypothetical protein
VKQILTYHYRLDQIKDAFAMAKSQNESLKMLIDYG